MKPPKLHIISVLELLLLPGSSSADVMELKNGTRRYAEGSAGIVKFTAIDCKWRHPCR